MIAPSPLPPSSLDGASASHWPHASRSPSSYWWSRSILMRQVCLCFSTSACGIGKLWNKREGCRPDSSIRSRRRRRRLQPCQFAVSWTVPENKPWPCRWAPMTRTTTLTLSRLAHWSLAGKTRRGERRNARLQAGQQCAAWPGSEEMETKALIEDALCAGCLIFNFFIYRFALSMREGERGVILELKPLLHHAEESVLFRLFPTLNNNCKDKWFWQWMFDLEIEHTSTGYLEISKSCCFDS